jgi:hypothetical protein
MTIIYTTGVTKVAREPWSKADCAPPDSGVHSCPLTSPSEAQTRVLHRKRVSIRLPQALATSKRKDIIRTICHRRQVAGGGAPRLW